MKSAKSEINRELQIRKFERQIVKLDQAFSNATKELSPCTFGTAKPDLTHYQSLIRSVLAQQVSKAAAITIGNRLKNLCGGRVTPDGIALLTLNELHSIGLTSAKVRTISEFTTAVLDGKVNFRKIIYLNDEAIIKELSSLYGFGKWTAEMFLIFQLGRLDVWPVDDLAVRRGWDRLHPTSEPATSKVLHTLGEPFTGMRSIVAWYCWRASEK
jgi:DNA-3-methyladenine glycosylase II